MWFILIKADIQERLAALFLFWSILPSINFPINSLKKSLSILESLLPILELSSLSVNILYSSALYQSVLKEKSGLNNLYATFGLYLE